MADFTPVAGGIQAPDATKTLSSLAQFQMAQAHSGLYQLQSQQLGMKINALQAYGSAKAAGDPNAIAHVMAIDPEMGKNILGAEEAQRSMRMRQLGAAATYINGLDARDRPQAEIQTWNDLAHRGLIDPMTYAMWKDRMGTNDPGVQKMIGALVSSTDEGVKAQAELEPKIAAEKAKAGATPQKVKDLQGREGYDVPGLNPQFRDYYGNNGTGPAAGGASPVPPTGPRSALPPVQGPFTGDIQNGAGTPAPAGPQRSASLSPQPTAQPAPPAPIDSLPGQRRTPAPIESQMQPEREKDQSRMAQGPSGYFPGPTTQATHEAEETGKFFADTRKQYTADAEAGQNQNSLIAELRENLKKVPMGKGAEAYGEVLKYVRSAASALGPLGADIVKQIDKAGVAPGMEASEKIIGQFVRVATRETSPRAAWQELQFIRGTLINLGMTRPGAMTVLDQMEALNDHKVARELAADAWAEKHNGSIAGFASAYRNGVSPTLFYMARLPDNERQAAIAEMQKTDRGRDILAQLQREQKWASQNGLADFHVIRSQ